MRKFSILIFFILFFVSLTFAEIEFQLPAFKDDNNLVFTAKTEVPGMGMSSNLFSVQLEDSENGYNKSIQQLSVFPEEASMINGNQTLQIRNRFGIFRTTTGFKKIEMLQTFSSFIKGKPVITGKLYPLNTSPNGDFLTYLKPVSYAYGDLILYDVNTGNETLISKDIELNFSKGFTLWSPNSKFFIYSKNNYLFYYSIEKLTNKKQLSDDFRKIGKGSIRNVEWMPDNVLYYIKDKIVYKILSAELFTSSLYNNLLQPGEIVGKIPFAFNSFCDSFCVSPSGYEIIFNKSDSNLFVYPLKKEYFNSVEEIESLPYLYLPENTKVEKIYWSLNGIVTVLVNTFSDGEEKKAIYRLDLENNEKSQKFQKMIEKDLVDIEISLNASSIAVIYSDRIDIKDYKSWLQQKTYKLNDPLKVFWINAEEIIVIGRYAIEKYNLQTNTTSVISISQANSAGYTKNGNIFAINKDEKFLLDEDGFWKRVSIIEKLSYKAVSDNLRSYLQPLTSGPYKNMIILKRLDSVGTSPLFTYPMVEYETFEADKEKVNILNFSHGLRSSDREISIVFNAVDSADGLTFILKTLKDYNIKTTFFLNGDFMRRNPEAVKELANSKHEMGSLFFVYFNMSDSRYRMDKDFIKQGLAKNEDDYYKITGKELSLLWHAPYYAVNSEIIDISAEMNYHYINRDIYTLEWIKKESYSEEENSTSDMIDKIMNDKKPGSIIPITIGGGNNQDSLYYKLELLVDHLIKKGYTVVPVSSLLEKAISQE